jgi:hypothetical protein
VKSESVLFATTSRDGEVHLGEAAGCSQYVTQVDESNSLVFHRTSEIRQRQCMGVCSTPLGEPLASLVLWSLMYQC